MIQLSKIIQSRDEWREKAKKRAEELWEMRKVHKYYQERVSKLVEENKRLKAEVEVEELPKEVKKKI